MTRAVPTAKGNEGSFELAKWLVFGVLILTYILVYFHRMAPAVVSEELMAAFQTTGTQLGALSAIYFFVYACMQLPSGVIADTLGTRTSAIGGNLIAGSGSILFGMSQSFEMACVGRFLVGLGVSVVFVAIMKNNSTWFHERVFALMSGVTLFIGNIGSVLAAGPLAALLGVFSWSNIFIAIGLFSILLSVLSYIIVKNKPEDLGFTSPNVYKTAASMDTTGHWYKDLARIVKTLKVWPGFWIQFGMIGSLYSFMGLWGIRYLQDVRMVEKGFAAQHMTIMLMAFAVGALFFGWFSDKIGKRKPVILLCAVGYLGAWLLLMYTSWSPGAMGYLLFGFMGLMGSGFVVTFAAAKEVINPNLSGMAVSVVNTGCFIGTAIMQPLFGRIVDMTWDGTVVNKVRIYAASDYHNGFLVVLAFSVIAVLGAIRLHETHGRNIHSS